MDGVIRSDIRTDIGGGNEQPGVPMSLAVTVIDTATGLPAQSLPCGFTSEGLPIGLQIVSRAWADAKALNAGYAFEQATEWHKRFPKV
jgi:aspartyl-tRNA(Asn)/glutamyl-tRNA(Gln) amidotransferase subunit A